MRICKQCNRKYAESAVFCPDCGEKLIDYSQMEADHNYMQHSETNKIEQGENGIQSNLIFQIKSKTTEWDKNDNIFMRWLPSIISVLGLVTAWEWDAAFGLVIAICGVLFGWFSKNQLNQIIATVVGIITILLCVVYGF